MADPLLNERMILADLDKISSLVNAPGLKAAAKLVLIDTFDRRPNREPFAELVQDACTLHANLSRLEFAEVLRKMLAEGKALDQTLLDQTVKTLTEVCEGNRDTIAKKFKLVAEMRLSDDSVH